MSYLLAIHDAWLNASDNLALAQCPVCDCVLDAGAGSGRMTQRLQQVTKCKTIKTADIKNGVDLCRHWPYRSESFDLVFANQVIEHLYHPVNFLIEAYRCLRVGGRVILATENLASWPNMLVMLCNYMPFSLANICQRRIGRLFAVPHGWKSEDPYGSHITVFSPRGLSDLITIAGFRAEVKVRGWRGYFMCGVGTKELK